MREIETFEESRESALHGRGIQIALGAALAVACAVFAAGVIVGRKGAGTGARDSEDHLTRLDEALAADEPGTPDAPLTFHRTLVEPEAPTVSPSELAAIGAAAPAPRGQQAAAPPGPAVVHLQRGGEEETPASPGQPAPAAAVPEGSDGPFTLQVASYQDEGEARRTSARLRGEGFRTFITAADIPDRGTWFRVRIGPFRSQGEVDRHKRDYEERMRAPAIVVKREDTQSASRRRH
ncbi:MAG: SPOR domain-containing protein [Deltaproteobacteria bacterium]|nr:SPOR domain-containing protein [Deltaproteobacteria bacterium]